MPKDPWKNQPNYKIGGGQLNEYEFNQQHGALTEQERSHLPGQPQGQAGEAATDATPTEGDPNENPEARRIRELMEEVHEKVARKQGGRKSVGAQKSSAKKPPATGANKSAAKGGKKVAAKGAAKSAAKGGAKSGAQKSGAGKGSAKKSSGAKKSGARGAAKGGAKKSATKKSAGAKGSKKGGARGR